VVFRPGVEAADAFAAAAAIDGRIIWSDAAGRVLAIDLPAAESGGIFIDIVRFSSQVAAY
jgi:hypothetical protein